MNRHHKNVVEYLIAENRVLREQLGDKRLRFTDQQRRRLATKGKALGRKALRALSPIVTPDTILKWHRGLIAEKYDGSQKRGPGRPPVMQSIRELVVKIATECPGWGYTRIRGALDNLGHHVGRNTIKRILLEHGLEPAPERGKRMPWKTFIKAHWGAIAATDFFSVEVLTLTGLIRYYVLFVIDLESRRVEIAGITHSPSGPWMKQIARNLTDQVDGFLVNTRFLIHDRDPLFTKEFRDILDAVDVECVRLPPKSPNLSPYAERFVRSIKEECLSKIVPLGEEHLRSAVFEFAAHYHFERNHQGLQNRLIIPPQSRPSPSAAVRCRERLGSLLRFYHREAA